MNLIVLLILIELGKTNIQFELNCYTFLLLHLFFYMVSMF